MRSSFYGFTGKHTTQVTNMATDKAGATIKYTKPWLQTSLETAVLWSINQIYKVYYHCDMTKVTCGVNIIENSQATP